MFPYPSSSLDQQSRAEVQHIASAPTAHRRSRKSPRYRLRPSEEVWSSPIPPAPSSIKPARKFSIPPPPRPRTAEAGNSHPGTVFTHPKRSGVPPSLQLPRASNPRGSSAYRLRPDRAPQKPEIPTPVPPSPIPKRSELIYLQTACKRGKYGVYLSLKRIKRKVGNTGKIKWA